ncbi:chain-length determining protein [Microbacteriaceae bacterium VKM Ac-2855]|nr:chain-length determining protein [Microbacteriaceae bacterium VKM Ac-2855]
MDPISVLRTLWNHRLIAFSVFALTAIVGAYVFFFSARSYESTATYALVNPAVPTALQIEKDPALEALNPDNPYLRSSDNSLAAQVLVSKLNSDKTVEALDERGLSTTYAVTRSDWSGQGLVLTITSDAPTAKGSIATTEAVGALLVDELHAMQTVNGASEEYLYTALQVEEPDRATEQVSNRLRALIIVAAGGFVLLFGAVSVARAIDNAREVRRAQQAQSTSLPESARRRREPPAGGGSTRTRRTSARAAAPTLPAPVEEPRPEGHAPGAPAALTRTKGRR